MFHPKTFRLWWHRPRMHDPEQERKVSWLELFYDLVYVVVIAELAHALAGHPDVNGILTFAFLFLPVWFAWTNGTYYHDVFETYDLSIRVFTFLQMVGVIGMAVFAHHALGEGSTGFALSYAFHHALMTLLWWRAGHHDERYGHTAPYTIPYILPYSLSVLLFVLSVFVPTPFRFYLWAIALLLDFMAPLLAARLIAQHYSFSQRTSAKMCERFGLFALIVLGEGIVGTVQGMAVHEDVSGTLLVSGFLGILIPFGLWWIYFDTSANREVKSGIWFHNLWLYSHFLLYLTITATGAGLLNVIEAAGHALPSEVWLLLGSALGSSLITLALLQLAFESYQGVEKRQHQTDMWLKGVAGLAAISVGIFAEGVGAHLVLALLSGLVVVVVIYIVRVWLALRIKEVV